MIKCIIVEDDSIYSSRLIKLLGDVDEQVEVLSVVTNVRDALTAINDFCPELIFLDIELGNETGFDLLKKSDKIVFDIIFTTAHIDNNIGAIRECAVSYLPKPIVLSELEAAIKKYLIRHIDNKGHQQVSSLKANLQIERAEDRVIWINDNESNYFPVEIRNIIYCLSDNQYTKFFIKSDQTELSKWISTKGIGEWEKDLEHYRFCRIHNRYLINLKHLVRYTKGDGGSVQMSSGQVLDVSKERKQKFLKLSGIK